MLLKGNTDKKIYVFVSWNIFIFHQIPLARYLPTWRGNVIDASLEMNPSRVLGMSLSINAEGGVPGAKSGPGDFRVEIDWIKAIRTLWVFEKQYCMRTLYPILYSKKLYTWFRCTPRSSLVYASSIIKLYTWFCCTWWSSCLDESFDICFVHVSDEKIIGQLGDQTQFEPNWIE